MIREESHENLSTLDKSRLCKGIAQTTLIKGHVQTTKKTRDHTFVIEMTFRTSLTSKLCYSRLITTIAKFYLICCRFKLVGSRKFRIVRLYLKAYMNFLQHYKHRLHGYVPTRLSGRLIGVLSSGNFDCKKTKSFFKINHPVNI